MKKFMKTFAVIGDPIDHSLSPTIHNAAFRELKLDHTYIAYRIAKNDLKEGIESLKKISISGFNVTIPHKINVIKYMDSVDENCSIIGAVNTVKFSNGKLKGYNTDMDGFLEPIKKKNITIKDADVLLLGAGGAARAITTAFAKQKAHGITIANKSIENATKMVKFAKNMGIYAKAIRIDEIKEITDTYKFIINSTPIGLKNEPSPIPSDIISKDSIIYDIVYMPINTDLLRKSKKKGATVIYGYEMLLEQACKAFKIWHNKDAPYNAMKRSILGGF